MSVSSGAVFRLKNGCELSVAIPASLVSDVPHLREKTFKIGLVGRAAAIFRVDEFLVFPDLLGVDQGRDTRLVAAVLSYMETPQYLRKRLFRLVPELRYAGILPPLRTPHHPVLNRVRDLGFGEYREGVVISSTNTRSIVDVGVERSVLVSGVQLPVNNRVTVKIVKLGRHLKAVLASRGEVEAYWGYRVGISDVGFGHLVKEGGFDLVVATSRGGIQFMEVVDELIGRWKKACRVLVAFGSPSAGLFEILEREGLRLGDVVDFVVNMVPNQGTATVRTVEALHACLGVLNLFASGL